MTGRVLLKRYQCRVCGGYYVLRRNGTIPWHGRQRGPHCPGSRLPPKPPDDDSQGGSGS